MSYFLEETRMKSWEAVLFQAAVDISIPPSLYKTIEERYGTLEGILNASDIPALQSAHIFPQGSIRLKTAIKPLSDATGELDTVDADAVVWLDDADSATAEVILAAFLDRFEKGSRVDAEIEPLRRGVRVKYADDKPGFHIDVTPARNASGNSQDSGNGALEVPDRDLKDWKASSPIQYSDWLQTISEKELPVLVMENFREGKEVVAKATMEFMPDYDEYVDANVLRALIKLIKRTRDVWAHNHPDDDKYRPISAILTTLAGKAYEKLANQGTQILVSSPFEVMQAVIDTMPEFIDGSEGQWEVLNPVNDQENFAEKWNRPDGMKYRAAFDDWHTDATKAFSLGLEEFSSNASFQEALNESFFIGSSTVEQTLKQLPKDWNLPGRKLGDTGTKIALGILGGNAVASSNQQSVKQPDRLG